jgi:predicted glycogen debranching enzyme
MTGNSFHAPLMQDLDFSATREFLVAASSGAYAASTIAGCNTRKYHGLMVMPQPALGDDNYTLLSLLDETLICNDVPYDLSVHRFPGVYSPQGHLQILKFEANPLPQWTYQAGDEILLKELLMDDDGTLMIRYSLHTGGQHVKLRLRPFLAFRNMHWLTKANTAADKTVHAVDNGIMMKLYPGYQELFLQLTGGVFEEQGDWYYNFEYTEEQRRGYAYQEDLYTPGYFEVPLLPGELVVFSGSLALKNVGSFKERFKEISQGVSKTVTLKDHLVNAADQFLTRRATGTIIKAGYYWFGSWGRDTCISLPGLTLLTGQTAVFESIINVCVGNIQDGMLPNIGNGRTAEYNSVDATLWLVWALQQYAEGYSSYKDVWNTYGKVLRDILYHYKTGTRYHIQMDQDGLLTAGEPGVALTWMDAIAPEGPVTQRMGKAVDVNALWYNAVCYCLKAAKEADDKSFISEWESLPKLIADSFVASFWEDEKGYLADCITGDNKDWSIRPNQLFAVSLPFTPLSAVQQRGVMEKIKTALLTPRGLRTLSPDDAHYIGHYEGDQPSRDRAYHQGTVWPWLLGHFTEGMLKADGAAALPFLKKIYDEMKDVLDEYGLNTIPEVFDGNAPHKAGGAVSQAWSVAELLRMEHIISSYSTVATTPR